MDSPSLPAAGGPEKRLNTGLVAVMLAGVCTFIDVYLTQPLLPMLEKLFHAPEVAVSLTVSATTLGIAVAAPIVGMLAERIGRKRVIVPSIFLLAVPTLLAATAPTLRALIVWRFLQGLFVPGIAGVMIAYVGEEFAGHGVGKMMAAYISGTVMGGFLGRFIAGIVATDWHWRAAFLVMGAIDLAGGLVVRAWLPPASRFERSPDLGSVVRAGLAHFRNPRLVAVFAMGFMVLFSLVGAFTYASFYLARPPFHLGPAALGSVFFVYLFGIVVTPAAGAFMDRHGFRAGMALALGFSLAGLVLSLVHSLVVVIAGLALFAGGIFISQAAATVQTGVVARGSRSTAAGLYVTSYYVGGSFGAVVPAWAWTRGGWPACVVLLAASASAILLFGFSSARTETA